LSRSPVIAIDVPATGLIDRAKYATATLAAVAVLAIVLIDRA
jgi:hypothetical protein